MTAYQWTSPCFFLNWVLLRAEQCGNQQAYLLFHAGEEKADTKKNSKL